MNRWFLITSMESREMEPKSYVFGPYKDYEKAQEASIKVGPGEIIELPTNKLEEAVEMLNDS